MTDERPGKERDADLWERGVAVLPVPAVERVHELRRAGDNADRQSAADHLAVRGEVRADAEVRLRAARAQPESSHDLVEDQRGCESFGDAAKLVQELPRLQVETAALHGLDEHGGDLGPVRPQVVE